MFITRFSDDFRIIFTSFPPTFFFHTFFTRFSHDFHTLFSHDIHMIFTRFSQRFSHRFSQRFFRHNFRRPREVFHNIFNTFSLRVHQFLAQLARPARSASWPADSASWPARPASWTSWPLRPAGSPGWPASSQAYRHGEYCVKM